MISAQEALKLLREGNHHFVSNKACRATLVSHKRRTELTERQQPFAIVLGCSDSRVPVEIVFDQTLGDLFVVRVAGNIASSLQIGSIEFAAVQFGARLVVVLGHSHCGAIMATVKELQQPTESRSRYLRAIVDHIRPAVEDLMATKLRRDTDALIASAVRANVSLAVKHLRCESDILRDLIRDDGLLVVGAEYSLETGVIEFFDGIDGPT